MTVLGVVGRSTRLKTSSPSNPSDAIMAIIAHVVEPARDVRESSARVAVTGGIVVTREKRQDF